MSKSVFRRKIYDEILEWKVNRSDKYALLIKGARRVGKSTIAEEFAKNEFKSYILIDFANTSRAIIDLFDDIYDLDFFFFGASSVSDFSELASSAGTSSIQSVFFFSFCLFVCAFQGQ